MTDASIGEAALAASAPAAFASAAGGLLAARIRWLPSVTGFMLVGLVIGPSGAGLFSGLALGIDCRWMQARPRLTRVESGGGGDMFSVVLFVFAGANPHLRDALLFAPVAAAFVGARIFAKVGATHDCGLAFGESHRRALASGLLLVPMAGLAIGRVQTTRQPVPELGGWAASIVLARQRSSRPSDRRSRRSPCGCPAKPVEPCETNRRRAQDPAVSSPLILCIDSYMLVPRPAPGSG